jgi:hypothetical protein
VTFPKVAVFPKRKQNKEASDEEASDEEESDDSADGGNEGRIQVAEKPNSENGSEESYYSAAETSSELGNDTSGTIRKSARLQQQTIIKAGARQIGTWTKCYQAAAIHIINGIGIEVPTSHAEAMKSKEWKEWQQAMELEIESLVGNGTFRVEQMEVGRKRIDTKWVYALKLNEEGTKVMRFKARLVVKGFKQKAGFDYSEIFAPVISQTSLRMTIAVAQHRNWEMKKFDFETAFLNGIMDHVVYINIPQGTTRWTLGEQEGLRLVKALYGTKQAARVWNCMLHEVLIKMGFKANEGDSCLYIHSLKNMYLAIYVDDLALFFKDKKDCEEFEQVISKQFRIGKASDGNLFIGMHAHHDITAGISTISQERYITGVVERFGQVGANPVRTPMDTGFEFTFNEKLPIVTNKPYRELIGCLMYAANGVRADCTFAVNGLARYVNRPQIKHWEAAIRVLRYLGSTRRLGLTFKRKENQCRDTNGGPIRKNNQDLLKRTRILNENFMISDLGIQVYVDADWGSDKEDFKSQSGYLVQCMGAPVIWRSRKQQGHSLSTMEAEYVALSEVSKEVMWLNILLNDMGFRSDKAIVIYEDNTACIELAKEPRHREKAKHINMRQHYVRELISDGIIVLEKIASEEMVADMLTKPLGFIKFHKHRNTAGLFDTGTGGVLESVPEDELQASRM